MPEILHLLRATIQAASPISSASGDTGVFDMMLVRDANGLPEIAGASIQGALRHLYEEAFGGNVADTLFGFAEEDRGAVGRLFFSFAKVHGANDEAVTDLRADAPNYPNDLLLRVLAAEAPLQRDHVRLSHRHVVTGRGKFDRVAVPKGTRFSFEIAMWGKSKAAELDKKTLFALASLLKHPAFRIGGATRRGYGKVTLRSAGYRTLGLDDPPLIRDTRDTPHSDRTGFDDITGILSDPASTGVVTIKLTLKPFGLWRVGSTGLPLRTQEKELRLDPDRENDPSRRLVEPARGGPDLRNKDVDAALVREPWIEWVGSAGRWVEPSRTSKATFTIPGTAIKGPLAHRALFHWNRLAGRMIDPAAWEDEPDSGKRMEIIGGLVSRVEQLGIRANELESLFGTEKDRAEGTPTQQQQREARGRAARIIIDDTEIEHDASGVTAIDHNSIDRFTGGVRNRILYSEEVAFGGEIHLTITILPPLAAEENATEAWNGRVSEALCYALQDLCKARLAIGAKSLGFCEIVGQLQFDGDVEQKDMWETAWEKAVHADKSGGRAA